MMKLKITNELKKLVPSFKVSCYTFTTLEKNDKENLSNDLTEAFNNIAKEYQKNIFFLRLLRFLNLKVRGMVTKCLEKIHHILDLHVRL